MNRKELAIIAIITFITVLVWIVMGIYFAKTKSTLTDVQLQQIVPLTPTFDNDIIKQLEKREEE